MWWRGQPSPGSNNHLRLTRFGETITFKLDKYFYRPAENLCQDSLVNSSVHRAFCGKALLCHWPRCLVLIRTTQTYSCIFHLKPHLSFVITGFGNNSLGREQETGKRLSGNRGGQKRVNSLEKSALSFRISRPVSSSKTSSLYSLTSK